MSWVFWGAILVFILRFAAYNFGWNFFLVFNANYNKINTENYNTAMRDGVDICSVILDVNVTDISTTFGHVFMGNVYRFGGKCLCFSPEMS